MIFVISPAKRLDESTFEYSFSPTSPEYLAEAKALNSQLKEMSISEIGELMSISAELSKLNHERYHSFQTPFTRENAKPSLSLFEGDVYQHILEESYTEAEWDYAQDHLRILSGLYGILKPKDLIQPYRLEMGTKLRNDKGEDLYAFWNKMISAKINESFEKLPSNVLVNLASNEYFKSVDKKSLKGDILNITFKDDYEGKWKSISFYMKQARGAMCHFAIKRKIKTVEALKEFNGMDYTFNESLSKEWNWVFTR